MTLALLTALACLQPEACPQMARAYYQSDVNLRAQVRSYKRSLEAQVGRELMVAIPLATSMVAQKRLNVRLGRSLNLQVEGDQYILLLSTSY